MTTPGDEEVRRPTNKNKKKGDLWSEEYPGVSKGRSVEYEYLEVYPAAMRADIGQTLDQGELVRFESEKLGAQIGDWACGWPELGEGAGGGAEDQGRWQRRFWEVQPEEGRGGSELLEPELEQRSMVGERIGTQQAFESHLFSPFLGCLKELGSSHGVQHVFQTTCWGSQLISLPSDRQRDGRVLAKMPTRKRRLTNKLSLFSIAQITGNAVAGASLFSSALDVVVEAPLTAKTNHCERSWSWWLVFQGSWWLNGPVVVFEVDVGGGWIGVYNGVVEDLVKKGREKKGRRVLQWCRKEVFWWILQGFEEEGVVEEGNGWRHWKEGQKLGGGAHQGQSGWSKTTGARDL
ncbi:hypothetical protein BY996DRAFT_6513124 [Phakopsora pachyrhizi]|nr:hypothetical protein BY996DRAFT_6513124 [Phakopsora pachyrhizi]